MPRLKIPENLERLLTTPKRFKVVIGGRGSGKSQSVADIMLMKAETEQCRVGCFREFMNSIDDSVFSLFKEEIERLQLSQFTPEVRQIKLNGYEPFIFKGMARNIESIKSLHGCKYFWVEEAQTVSSESLKVLTPTLRTENSEVWFTGNPRSSEDAFSQRFITPFESELLRNGYYEDDLHLIIMMNWRDNPWFPDVLEKERQRDQKELSDAEYQHIWEGAHLDEVANSIIKPEWFNAAIDAVDKLGIKKQGAIVCAYDPADEGEDKNAYAIRKGIHFYDVDEIDCKDGNEGCDIATAKAYEQRAELFAWDGDGMGALLRRQVETALRNTDCRMYKGSNKPDNPNMVFDTSANKADQKTNSETFYNKRAQYYTELALRFKRTYDAVENGAYINPDDLISIDSKIPLLQKLKAEVCRVPRKTNTLSGKIQIMPKDQMKRLGIASPNMADCLAMAMEKPKNKAVDDDFNFEGWA